MAQLSSVANVDATSSDDVMASIKGTHDALSVSRCYGDPIELDGVTVIPVARVSGGAGGGAGQGEETDGSGGGGFGTGFGLNINPIGVYEARDGQLEWKPSLDVTRLARSGQVLAGIIAVCTTLVMIARTRRR